MLGGNLVSFLYGDVSVMNQIYVKVWFVARMDVNYYNFKLSVFFNTDPISLQLNEIIRTKNLYV